MRDKLGAAIEENRLLGKKLGVDNMKQLHAERALLVRERELLNENEDGKSLFANLADERYEEECG